MHEPWFQVEDVDRIPSPALLVFPERVENNIRRLVEMAGDPARLRPHVKTHKMPELVRRQLAHGITKFKCATIAEAEMCAITGAADVLLASQPVGPGVDRLRQLCEKYPETRIAAITDSPDVVDQLEKAFENAPRKLPLYLDLDCGMHRTGIEPGGRAIDLYRRIDQSESLLAGGLHAYDGHIHDQDLDQRTMRCESDFQIIRAIAEELREEGMPVPELVAGGSPTLPIHLRHADVTCSPGTVFLWDYGYGMGLPDLDFQVAALVLCRVISRPSRNRVCVDLGHKAVAAENPHPRVRFLNLLDGEAVMQSEEHLVLESINAEYARIGDVLYGVPRHICPTVALYDRAFTVEDGRLSGEWEITARDRRLSI